MKTKISHTKKVTRMPPEYVEGCRQYFHDERMSNPDDVNGKMSPEYIATDYEEGTMTLRFTVKEWELNRVGVLHGGITSTMMDHATGSAIFAFIGHWCPSVDMDIRFMSQAVLGDVLICVGRVVHCGERFVTADCVMTNETNGRLVATCVTTCANGAKRAEGAMDKGPIQER